MLCYVLRGAAVLHRMLRCSSQPYISPSDAPEGDLARLVARDQGVRGASRQRAHAVVVAVQRAVERRAQGAQPPAPHQLRTG